MNQFLALVMAETERVRSKGPKPMTSHHQAYGLIAEEFDEFWEEVKKKSNKRDTRNMLMELVQIAGLCQRAAEDLGMLEASNGKKGKA